MTTTIRIIMGLAAAGCMAAASAQGVWRCGDTYVQQPCPGGREVQVQDARTPADRAANREAVDRDARLAESLQKAREKAESQPASVYAPPAAAERLPDAVTADHVFTAREPGKPRAKKGKTKASGKGSRTEPATGPQPASINATVKRAAKRKPD